MVIWSVENALGGEIFVPKIPSYRILDVAEAVGPSCSKNFSGIRPGEKLHEEMITHSDSANTVDLGNYYAILPGNNNKDYSRHAHAKGLLYNKVENGFSYNSGTNKEFLSVENIRSLIKKHIDINFTPR